jgi:hypothetical protein
MGDKFEQPAPVLDHIERVPLPWCEGGRMTECGKRYNGDHLQSEIELLEMKLNDANRRVAELEVERDAAYQAGRDEMLRQWNESLAAK